MKIRINTEQREKNTLSGYACKSSESRGRRQSEPACEIRTCYQVDRDRILHSKAFRRLKYKTQVFLSPEGDHYRTRLTHTLEVSQIARTISRALALNEDLVEAIALGHDLGHTPFGHAGEKVLAKLVPGGFRHVTQSLRVVERLEKDGAGLNLSAEVLDGIGRHSKGTVPLHEASLDVLPKTLEGQIVRIADIIAYVNHDLDDALRGGMVRQQDIPAEICAVTGAEHASRINAMVKDLLETSIAAGGGVVRLSATMSEAIGALRKWLSEHVYHAVSVNQEFLKAARIIEELFNYYVGDDCLFEEHGGSRLGDDSLEVSVADFIAGMTDRYAIKLYHELFLPRPWKGLDAL
ncbi:MAG TPA: deoxyguanosinetriphosphate triphosphohydrolase [Geothermobacteraceae bacterium]|nr:deoxyguanosinetriphosphate triphosphohydrolase [Geothermobacteraceae bacterium]